MKDITEILNKIKAMPQDELRTQELYEQGLTKYYLAKLVE